MDNLQNFTRSGYCGDLRLADAGKTVSLCGWVQRQRDLGGLIFVDLRDRTGLVQLSFDDGTDRAIFEKAASLRAEYVIAATGTVRERESKTNKIATGDIEVYVTELRHALFLQQHIGDAAAHGAQTPDDDFYVFHSKTVLLNCIKNHNLPF